MRFREAPSSWYDPPDEPSDVAYDACRDAWVEHLEDYCDGCDWQPDATDENKPRPGNGLQPCGSCADDPPSNYDDAWIERYFEDRRNERYDV